MIKQGSENLSQYVAGFASRDFWSIPAGMSGLDVPIKGLAGIICASHLSPSGCIGHP